MGEKARRLFSEVGNSGGLVAKMRLASLARITSTQADTIEDTPEVLARLEDAVRRLRMEAQAKADAQAKLEAQTKTDAQSKSDAQGSAGTEGTVVRMQSAGDDANVLRRHLQTYVELMSQRSLLLGNVEATVRTINEAASVALNCERVSVWFLDEAQTKITCADLFVRTGHTHSAGTELFAKDFAPYFRALSTERTIAAADAHRDPRTECFSTVYLAPLGINSMLDVPIILGDKMVGVVCHEHVGPMRKWNSDEETFGYLMGNFVALALERRAKT